MDFVQSKTLLFDLETTAHEGSFWGHRYETDIIEVIKYGKILCYSAKWLGKEKIIFGGWNERKIVKELWKLFDEADILVAHNLKHFDLRWCLTKFSQYNLPRPSHYKKFDTLMEARKQWILPSYKLNDISDYFGLGKKIEHEGWPLWKKCIKGDKKARKKMELYNKQDVRLLEAIYNKLI